MNAPALHLRASWASRRLFVTAAVGPGSRRVAATRFRRKRGGSQHLQRLRKRSREVSAEAGKQFQTLRFPPDRYADWISIFCSTRNSYWVKRGGSNAAERGLQSHQIKTTHVEWRLIFHEPEPKLDEGLRARSEIWESAAVWSETNT